jgi:hypothetical protein
MANLYELLMAKERGNIKDAPNKQRIGQAPLNLRSAMKYAVGGLTDSDISAYVQANIGNPAAIAEAAQQYQVTAEDLARATGYSPEEVKTYFAAAGVGGPYREPESREEPVPPPPPGYEERQPLPPVEPRYRPEPPNMPPMPPVYDPPMPIAPSYPPNYFDPQPTAPTNVGYPLAPPAGNMPGGPVRTNPTPPSSGLLGSLGGYGLGAGQSSTGQSGGGLGAGLPGQSMQGQSQGAGMGQSLDSLINYLADYRKKA